MACCSTSLPLRKRPSAMHFSEARLLSITIISEMYVRRNQNLYLMNRLTHGK